MIGRIVAGMLGVAVWAMSAAGQTAGPRDLMGQVSVIDGDTLELHGRRIRLHGIDAPESGQACQRASGGAWRCGQEAALALAREIGHAPVRCEGRSLDRYGRFIAVCFKGRQDLGRWMVAQGFAVAYRRYALDYVVEEDRAHRNHQGLWAGNFEMPWDWRSEHHRGRPARTR